MGVSISKDYKKYLKWAIALIVPAALYLLLPLNADITEEIRRFLAITLWAILMWAFELMPVYISGLLVTMVLILSKTAPPEVVLNPWIGNVVWLSLGGLTISLIFEKSGLMDRIAYFFIVKTGGLYKGIIWGLGLSGIVVGLLVPNMTGRVALYCALAYGIVRALKLPANSKTAAGIMFAGFSAAIAPSWMYLSASENLQLVNSYLAKFDLQVSFMSYLKSNAVVMLLWTILLIFMTQLLFKEDVQIESKDYFVSKYKALGPVKAKEIKFIVILVLLVLSMVFTSIAPGWLFTLAVIACFLPGVEIATAEDLKQINFGMVFFVAATMAIGSVSNHVGIAPLVSKLAIPLFQNSNNLVLMMVAVALGIVVDMFMTPLAGMAAFSPVLIEIAKQLGLSTYGVTFAFVWGVEQLFFPYEWALFLILFSYNVFDFKKAVKWSTIRTVLAILFMLAVIYPVWHFTGFLLK